MILAADTVFDFENFDGLIEGIFNTLWEINNQIEIICCFTHRFGDVEKWFREGIEQRGFTDWVEVPMEEYPPQFQEYTLRKKDSKTGTGRVHIMKLKKPSK